MIQPRGEAFLTQENQQVAQILEQGGETLVSETQRQEEQGPSIRRLDGEPDGVMARLRRGRVPMDTHEQEREGEVSREVNVGAVCVGEPGPERSERVPGVCVDAPGPKRSVARRTTAEECGPHRSTLARQGGLPQQVVILGDGATWMWTLAEEHVPGAVQIVDASHAREHVWDVARAAVAAEPDRRDCWASQVRDLLSLGKGQAVIAASEKLPPRSPPPGKAKRVPETEAESVRTNRQRMRSPAFRAHGMHLGSGIAEAAWKTVVRPCATRSGLRWTPHGLAALLA